VSSLSPYLTVSHTHCTSFHVQTDGNCAQRPPQLPSWSIRKVPDSSPSHGYTRTSGLHTSQCSLAGQGQQWPATISVLEECGHIYLASQ
jgi:hypothetical protein